MATDNHTAIATGAAANASTINTPLGTLDAAIGNLATLTTTAKTSAVAAINEINAKAPEPVGGPRYSVGNHGCQYSTLSAALAAITDASAAKPYTLEVYGAVAETATVVAKSHVHVIGAPGASVTMTSTGSGYGFDFNGVTNTTWRGLKLVRAGAVSAGTFVGVFRGAVANTVRLENCVFQSITTGANAQTCVTLLDSAQPIFVGCEFIGGVAGNSSHGVIVQSSIPGPYFDRCIMRAGSGGTSGVGLYALDASHATARDCDIFGSTGGASSFGVRAQSKWLEMINCTVTAGSGGTNSAAIATSSGGSLNLRHCTTLAPIEQVSTAAITATGTVVLQASKPHQLVSLVLWCTAAAGGGVTVSVGTTLAGTDIINAYALTSTGRKFIPLGAGAATLLAAGATLYVTVSGAGSATFTLETTIEIAFATCYGLYLTGQSSPQRVGEVNVSNCSINSNCASQAMYVDANHVAQKQLAVTNTSFRARRAATGSPVAVECAAMWHAAPFYNCVFDGNRTINMQPATLVDGQTTSTPAIVPTAPTFGRQYLRRWNVQRGKIAASVSGEQAVVALLGDSWAQDDHIGRHLRTTLQTAYGDGGPGWVSGSNGGPQDQGVSSSKSGGGTWTELDMTTPATTYGIDGSHIVSANDTATWAITATFDTAVIHYIKQPDGGTFQYQVDSGAWTDVDTSAAALVFATEAVATAGAALNIRIKSGLNGAAGCTICGVDFREDGNGVRLHKIGNGGAKASDYVGIDSTVWSAGLAAIAPDAVIVLLGTNEKLQDVSPDSMASSLDTLIARIRAAHTPTPDVVLLCPSDNGETDVYTMAQVAQAIRATAQRNECGLVDLYALWGAYDADWITESLYYNNKHPDTLGGRIMAQAIAEQILA